jgi:hypothetical protein
MDVPLGPGFFEGIVRDLTSGKGQLRFLIQPLTAIILGVRLGVADAKEHQPPFLLRLFAHSGRRAVFQRSLSDVIVPLCLGIVIDGVLQHYTLGVVRPLHAVVVGMLLVWLPYAIARALTNRGARRHYRERRVTP